MSFSKSINRNIKSPHDKAGSKKCSHFFFISAFHWSRNRLQPRLAHWADLLTEKKSTLVFIVFTTNVLTLLLLRTSTLRVHSCQVFILWLKASKAQNYVIFFYLLVIPGYFLFSVCVLLCYVLSIPLSDLWNQISGSSNHRWRLLLLWFNHSADISPYSLVDKQYTAHAKRKER